MLDYFQEHLYDLTPPRKATVALLRFHLREEAWQAAEAARAELEQGQELAVV